jgi:hypothetical protein
LLGLLLTWMSVIRLIKRIWHLMKYLTRNESFVIHTHSPTYSYYLRVQLVACNETSLECVVLYVEGTLRSDKTCWSYMKH